jgi:hypothetical protein
MHPHGNLGPTDPQITNRLKGIQFGSEDLQSFLRFAREQVGLTDQGPMRDLFQKFSEEVGFVNVGVAARGTQLSMSIGEKMLLMHMKDDGSKNARAISESLNTKYFHHGYPLSRGEAQEIGLPVQNADVVVENLLWSIWKDLEADLALREAFVPVSRLKADPACSVLFSAGPPAAMVSSASTSFENTLALMESVRRASRMRVGGTISGTRQAGMDLKIQVSPEAIGWVDVPLPLPGPSDTPMPPSPPPGAS